MMLIGLLLVAVAAGFTADVFVQNPSGVDVDVLGRTFLVAPGWIVVAGIAALVVFLVGVRAFETGITRARRRRTTLRSAQLAAEERDRLAQQLASERAAREPSPHAVSGDEAARAQPDAPAPATLDR